MTSSTLVIRNGHTIEKPSSTLRIGFAFTIGAEYALLIQVAAGCLVYRTLFKIGRRLSSLSSSASPYDLSLSLSLSLSFRFGSTNSQSFSFYFRSRMLSKSNEVSPLSLSPFLSSPLSLSSFSSHIPAGAAASTSLDSLPLWRLGRFSPLSPRVLLLPIHVHSLIQGTYSLPPSLSISLSLLRRD